MIAPRQTAREIVAAAIARGDLIPAGPSAPVKDNHQRKEPVPKPELVVDEKSYLSHAGRCVKPLSVTHYADSHREYCTRADHGRWDVWTRAYKGARGVPLGQVWREKRHDDWRHSLQPDRSWPAKMTAIMALVRARKIVLPE